MGIVLNGKKSFFTMSSYNRIESVLLAYIYEDKMLAYTYEMFLMTQCGKLSVLRLHRFEYNLMYLLKNMLLMKYG